MRNLPAKVRQELDAKAAVEARRNKPKTTNADRIRAMSDEELAEFLEQVGDDGSCSVCGNLSRCRRNNAPEPVCSRHIKDWLQQPAPEVSNETDT